VYKDASISVSIYCNYDYEAYYCDLWVFDEEDQVLYRQEDEIWPRRDADLVYSQALSEGRAALARHYQS